ncbi:ABC transporter permease [Dactylosporangium sp. NPDC005572]|uniref:ABC transporter permease n=1 Tax=Dactylosporangium sp. NPDC005572 TaxID=3156889 RepID=UPI0033A81A06
MSTLGLALGLSRGRVEILQLVRQRDALIFTFAFPAILTVLLGAIFDEPVAPGSDTTHSQVFAAGMIAYGILSTAFISVGIGIAVDRSDGTLKRLRGTPATAWSYFTGKILLVLFAAVCETVLLVAVGVALFGLRLPSASGWLTLGWLLVLSVVACTLLGIAASSLARSARSAPAVLNLPVLVLQFTSGIFVHITSLPAAMVNVSAVFPVKWMGQGFRSVFLPDALAAQEVAGSWEHGRTALVLGAWCLAGLALSLLTFRWNDRR